MEVQQYKHQENTALIVLASGFGIIVALLTMQYVSVSNLSHNGTILLSQERSEAFDKAAIPVFGTIAFAVAIALSGVRMLVHSWAMKADGTASTKETIAYALQRHGRIFWLALSLYAIVFLFASNTVVFSAEGLSERFGVSIPTIHLIGCCGQPGNFPVITVYASEHIGFLFIPINLILAPFLSVLVGINACLILNRFNKIKQNQCTIGLEKNRVISYAGISLGLFAGCPACAGNFIISFVGMGSMFMGTASAATFSASALLANYQPVMIFASIASLIAALALNSQSR